MKSQSTLPRVTFALFVAASILGTVTDRVEAIGPRTWIYRSTHVPVRWQQPIRQAPSYWETYQYMNSRYPKYYGGFHASYFDNMGIPPGDIGLRGNGIYMTPW